MVSRRTLERPRRGTVTVVWFSLKLPLHLVTTPFGLPHPVCVSIPLSSFPSETPGPSTSSSRRFPSLENDSHPRQYRGTIRPRHLTRVGPVAPGTQGDLLYLFREPISP